MDFAHSVSDAVLAPFVGSSACTATALLFSVAVLLGAYQVVSFAVGIVLGLAKVLFSGSGDLRKKYGQWAVVTGATDGIGFAYCQQFAKRGVNVVLISRTESKLKEKAQELQALNPKIETRIIVADFSSTDDNLYYNIRLALSGLEIGILVNNVGMSYPGAMYFHEIDQHDDHLIDNMIALNVNATTQMTRLVVGDMVKRRRGAIINVSSAAGRIPTGNPLYALYSGTKAFVDFFSRSLHHELASSGVFVQCQSPYFVVSKLSKIRRSSLTTPKPEAYAKAAVNAIGSGSSVVPFWTHKVQDWVMQHLPESLAVSQLLTMHKALRKRYMAKEEEKRSSTK